MPANAASLIAIAAASVEAVSDGVPKKRIQLMPLGTIALRDGRGPFTMSKEVAHAVVAATRVHAGKTDIMVDYDHQSFYGAVEGVGGRAPAAGWISPASLSVEDDGIWAEVSWTPAAEAHLAAREYRYLSPLFTYDPATKAVRTIRNVGLVNTPAINELAAVASLNPHLDPKLETPMSLSKIAVAAGLLAGATEDEIVAHVTGLVAASAAIAAASQKLGLQAGATADELVAAASAKADPTKFVPIAVVNELRGEIAELHKVNTVRSADEVVAAALKAGKISPAMKGWADDYARKDLVGFQAYVAAAPAIVAAGEQFARQPDPVAGGDGLTADERAVAASMGLTTEAYLAAKKEGF
jgi:phage I-like protein